LRSPWRGIRSISRQAIEKNRRRAARYGLGGKLIDFGRGCELETRGLIHEILEFIADEADELGTHREIAHVEKLIREGTGADRQIAAWEGAHNMHDVVDRIVHETYERLAVPEPIGAA
jgi:glutamate---cysteine ligase / carboxylate-amine ligase